VIAKDGEFSVCLVGKDGSLVRKQYMMAGNAVRPAGVKSCDKSAPVTDEAPQEQALVKGVPAASRPSFFQRAKARVNALFAKR